GEENQEKEEYGEFEKTHCLAPFKKRRFQKLRSRQPKLAASLLDRPALFLVCCRSGRSFSSSQKLIRIDPCMTRGERADVEVPKLVDEPKAVSLVCLMTAPVVPSGFVTVRRPKVILPSMSLKFARLNIL